MIILLTCSQYAGVAFILFAVCFKTTCISIKKYKIKVDFITKRCQHIGHDLHSMNVEDGIVFNASHTGVP